MEHNHILDQKMRYEKWVKETRQSTQDASLFLFNKINARQSITNQDEILGMFQLSKDNVTSIIFMNSTKSDGFDEISDIKIIRSFKIIEQDIQTLYNKSTKIIHFYNFSLDKVPCDEITRSEQELHISEFIKNEAQFATSIAELEKLLDIYFEQKSDVVLFFIYLTVGCSFVILLLLCFLAIKNLIAKQSLAIQKKQLLHDETQKFDSMTKFVKGIINDNFESELSLSHDADEFSTALIKLKDKLKRAALDQQKQAEENEKRAWATQGLARFAEILRDNTLNLNDLAYNVISNIVKYLKANQGGLFILNDDDPQDKYLEITASYAFERRKHIKKRVELGEGLTGMCFLERKTMVLHEIPDDYLTIKSGMGYAQPRCLIIVPLRLNDDVYGTLEVASFDIIEPYQVEFVEKVGETICATIKNTKINNQTSRLLEQSRLQTEDMRSQQEEMRQHLEELAATQEELDRQNKQQSLRDKSVRNKYENELLNAQEMLLKEQEECNKKNKELDSLKKQLKDCKTELEEYRGSIEEEVRAQAEVFQSTITDLENTLASMRIEIEKYQSNSGN